MIRHIAFPAIATALMAGVLAGGETTNSGNTPAPAPDGWVVESVLYSRGPDIHSVICVPAADLALPDTERTTWQEYVTDKDTAYNAEQGDPCPGGEPR